MFRKGTVLTYKVIRNVDGLVDGSPRFEEHTVVSDDGLTTKFSVKGKDDETRTYTVRSNEDGCTIGKTVFTKVSSTPMQIEVEGGLVYVDILKPPMRCGGGETVYLGRDGIIYRDIKSQMWSMGVICKDVYTLVSINVDGRIYEDIRWVEESESGESDDT